MSDQPNTNPPDEITANSTPLSGAPPQRTTGGSMRWTPPSPEHLQRLLPQYEVLEIVGHGGMGAVYRAKQISLDRLVAIKILPPEAADDEQQFIQRFKNEARTMAKMLHPAIVAVFDFGETSEGQLYFVMEYVDGTDVSKMIKDQGKLLPEHALAITAHVCDALQYAHGHGIIHRDIKPANILLNKEGAVKVADFGLAKMHDPSLTMGLTQSGKTMGTPDFVAPESLTLGMVADHRADLYAIGVMLYQMLTGKIPRGTFKLPSQVVPGLDARFDAIVHRAMQEDRDDRYQSAQEIRSALDVILTTPEIKAEAAPAQQSAPPPRKPVARGPQTKTEAAPTASARDLAQQSAPPPHKPVARGPQTGHKSTPALAQSAPLTNSSSSAVVPKKPPIVPIGIGAAAMLGIGAFFLFKSPEPKPQPVGQIQEVPKPKPEIVKNEPPKVAPPVTRSSTTNPSEVLTFQAHRYQLQMEKLNWDQAKAKAESMGGHLATINSKEEDEWLLKKLVIPEGADTHIYLGGYKQTSGSAWSWVTGEPFDMKLWHGSIPNGSDTKLSYYQSKAWDDVAGGSKYFYLVEWDDDSKTKPADNPITPAPIAASAPLTGPVNLLALVDLERDVLEGGWKVTSDGLMASGQSRSRTLIFPQRTPTEYDYEIEFTIAEGWARCAMVLPLPQNTILWQMGTEDPTLSAFGPDFDGQKPNAPGRTEALARLPRLDTQRRYRCLVEVRKNYLRALLDGEEVLKWSGDFNQLSNDNPIIKKQADPKCLGLNTFATKLTFHKAELRPPSATVKPADKPTTTAPVIASAPLTGPVNLLAFVDVQRDAVEGKWEMTPEGLGAISGDKETLLFQRSAPEEYDYEIEFTITRESYNRCHMIFPLSHGSITWQMGLKNEGFTQFFFGPKFDGRPADSSEQADVCRLHPRLKSNKRYRCLVEVRKDSLRALLDGEEVLKWSGDLKRFSGINGILNGQPDQKRLGLFSFRTPLIFHKAELRPPSAPVIPADKPITVAPIAVAPTVPVVAPTPIAVAPPPAPTPAPAAPAGDPRLAQLEAGFKARYETDAQKPFDAAVATLKQSYATNGIPRARAAALAKGSLADVTALDAEKAAMENGTGVPAEDAADTPDSLKTLRNTYRSALAKITADRTAKAAPLYNLYLGALDVYTTELTKANKLDEARKVKALRDELAAKKPEAVTAAVVPPKTEPPKPFTTTTTKAPEVKPATGSSSRAAAKWLVANSSVSHGSSARILADGKELQIKTEQDIPPGKFDFIELDFGTGTKDLTDEGFQVFKGQKDLRSLKVASMHSPGLSDAAFAFLADNKDLTYVEMGNLEDIGDGLFVHLSGLKKITVLNFYKAKKFTGKGLDKLACLPVLTRVSLPNMALTDDALKALGTCQKLTNLNISDTPITDAGLAALDAAGSLQVLNINTCKNITGEGFAALRKLKSLTKLSVSTTSFDDVAAAAVADIKSLTNLDLGNSKITDAGLAKLVALTNLSEIVLKNTKVTDAGIAAFKKALPKCEVKK